MSQPVLLKVYANIWPVTRDILTALVPVLAQCLPEPEEPVAAWNAKLLTISFEGIYFPAEEVLSILKTGLHEDSQGKLDIIDLENWRLQRTVFRNGSWRTNSAPLNNVLDYSGH